MSKFEVSLIVNPDSDGPTYIHRYGDELPRLVDDIDEWVNLIGSQAIDTSIQIDTFNCGERVFTYKGDCMGWEEFNKEGE